MVRRAGSPRPSGVDGGRPQDCPGAHRSPPLTTIFPSQQARKPTMERESIRRDLAVFLETETGEPTPELPDGLNLREGLGLDSVDVVGLVMQVERTYRIRLSSEELEGLATVGALL